MNNMRKLMEIVEGLKDIQEVHGDAYVAASLYLNNQGKTKLVLARKLSEVIGVDSPTAMRIIDAIDAYEDIREAEEFKHVQEDSTDIQYPDNQDEDRNAPHEMNPREYAAFVYGIEWGNSAQFNDGGYDSAELPEAYKDWIESGRKGYYDD